MLKLRVPEGAVINKMKSDKVPVHLVFKDYKEFKPETKYVRQLPKKTEEPKAPPKPIFKISINELQSMIHKIKMKS